MSEAAEAALIWCPFGDEASAHAAAVTLVEERLVACANVLPCVTSIYRWQGEVMQGREIGVLFKTTALLLGEASERLAQLHPYDAPAIVGWQADRAPQVTLDWLVGQTRQGSRE
ncbi:MAG: divalent-cation tolerance protein CutA [Erythrobacter sp.]|nr:MAG: divalent-cation tolerance protein CutA [Erythrobacter sp.]